MFKDSLIQVRDKNFSSDYFFDQLTKVHMYLGRVQGPKLSFSSPFMQTTRTTIMTDRQNLKFLNPYNEGCITDSHLERFGIFFCCPIIQANLVSFASYSIQYLFVRCLLLGVLGRTLGTKAMTCEPAVWNMCCCSCSVFGSVITLT